MKNLLISFPGGCGGNHLANLISLNDKFTPRFKSNDYHRELTNLYKDLITKPIENTPADRGIFHKISSHFSDFLHLSELQTEEDFQKKISLKTINIFTGHEHLFYRAEKIGKFISRMPDTIWITLTHPKINSIVYNRCKVYKIPAFPGKYIFPIDGPNCNFDFPKIDSKKILKLTTEDFVSKNGCDYLKTELLKIDIELHDLAYELHEIWYNKLIVILTKFDLLPTKYNNEYGDLN